MITVLLLTIGIVGALMAGMAVGVLFSNKPLRGSCGGVTSPDCLCAKEGRDVGDCGKQLGPAKPYAIDASELPGRR